MAHNLVMLTHWVAAAPCNFAHWHRLVEAERKSLRLRETNGGRQMAAMAEVLGMYEEVFDMALANGFVQDAAMAKELSWQVMNEMASQCAAESFFCFAKWGANRAVRQRKAASHSRDDESQLGSGDRGGPGNVSLYTTTEIVASALDFDAVVQAAQQVSSMLNTKASCDRH